MREGGREAPIAPSVQQRGGHLQHEAQELLGHPAAQTWRWQGKRVLQTAVTMQKLLHLIALRLRLAPVRY